MVFIRNIVERTGKVLKKQALMLAVICAVTVSANVSAYAGVNNMDYIEIIHKNTVFINNQEIPVSKLRISNLKTKLTYVNEADLISYSQVKKILK